MQFLPTRPELPGSFSPEGYVEDCDEPRKKLREFSRNLPAGCSNRLSSKAAAEEQAAGVTVLTRPP
jgi:hypothetical protein